MFLKNYLCEVIILSGYKADIQGVGIYLRILYTHVTISPLGIMHACQFLCYGRTFNLAARSDWHVNLFSKQPSRVKKARSGFQSWKTLTRSTQDDIQEVTEMTELLFRLISSKSQEIQPY